MSILEKNLEYWQRILKKFIFGIAFFDFFQYNTLVNI